MNRRVLWLLALVWQVPIAFADEAPLSSTVLGAGNEHLLAAADALRAGDADAAIRESLLGLAEIVEPKDRAGGLANLCGAYLLAEEMDLAIARCTDSLELRERWQTYHNRALAHLHKRQLDHAERDIEAGLALKPDSVLLGRARAALEQLRRQHAPRPVASATERG
jgi:hypothetical protein